MTHYYYIPIIIGGLFLVIGLVIMLWGRRGEKRFDETLASKTDVKEFLEHWPKRLSYNASQLGGWISIIVGVILLVLGIIFSQSG